MSTEQEKKVAALAELLHVSHKSYQVEPSCDGCAARAIRLLDSGVDIALPPEPEWKPGQVVRLRLEDDMPYLAKRVDSNDGWEVFGVDVVITDDEVTDVEPVTVLTAEDAGGVAARVAQRMVASGISGGLWAQVAGEAVEDEFRERGLDL